MSSSRVDFVQFGPADFSMNSGFNAKEEVEKVREAEEKVIKTALKYGVSPRAEINSAEEAERYIKLGVRHFALGSELKIEKMFWTDNGECLMGKLNDLRGEKYENCSIGWIYFESGRFKLESNQNFGRYYYL